MKESLQYTTAIMLEIALIVILGFCILFIIAVPLLILALNLGWIK